MVQTDSYLAGGVGFREQIARTGRVDPALRSHRRLNGQSSQRSRSTAEDPERRDRLFERLPKALLNRSVNENREDEPPSPCDASDGLETLRVYAAISKAISPWLAPCGGAAGRRWGIKWVSESEVPDRKHLRSAQ